MTVRVETPKGWSIEGQTAFVGALERDLVMDVTIQQMLRAIVRINRPSPLAFGAQLVLIRTIIDTNTSVN
jgi:hypothetical protein